MESGSNTFVCLLSAPAQVARLQVTDGGCTDSLEAQWERAAGDLDSYRVLLVHDSSVIKNQSVEANTSSISFHALRPGALYKVVLTTVRAGQTSRQTVAEGRTGKTDGATCGNSWGSKGCYVFNSVVTKDYFHYRSTSDSQGGLVTRFNFFIFIKCEVS